MQQPGAKMRIVIIVGGNGEHTGEQTDNWTTSYGMGDSHSSGYGVCDCKFFAEGCRLMVGLQLSNQSTFLVVP